MNNIKLSAFADEASVSFDEQIIAMKENGIDFLEIRGVDGINISNLSMDQVKTVQKKLSDNGLSVWSIGSPSGKIDIKEAFEPHLDKFKHMIEAANIFGAPCFRLFSFYGTDGKPEYRDEVMLKLSRFCEAAKGSGVILCHENEKGIYGDNTERCLEILKAIPEIKGIFDPANFIQCGVETLSAWEMLAPFVKYMHIKDALPDGNVVPAGFGAANIPQILKQYIANGGTVMTLEPHLSVFKGLGELEHDEKSVVGQGEFKYPSQRAAFDAAVNALKDILNKI